MDNKLVKRCLNLIIVSFILIALTFVLAIVIGFIDASNEGTIITITRIASIIALLAGIPSFIGYYYGKKGGNKCFGIAFWIQVGVIAMNIVMIVFDFCNVTNSALLITFNVISTLCSISVSFFSCFGCKEAVPEMNKLAIWTFVFYGVALLLSLISRVITPANVAEAFTILGGLVALVGIILYVTLIVKTRNRIPK